MSLLEHAGTRPDRRSHESPEPPGLAHRLRHLDPIDRRRFIDFGWGPVAEPSNAVLDRAFEVQAERRPDAIAVEHGNDRVTYAELDAMAETVAVALAARGVGRGDLIGLFVERSIPMVAAMLGVLRVGAAYVPQHAGVAPPQQLRYIVERTEAPVVLTLSNLRRHLPTFEGVEIIDVDRLLTGPPAAPPPRLAPVRPVRRRPPCRRPMTRVSCCSPPERPVLRTVWLSPIATWPTSCSPTLATSGSSQGMRVGQILSIAFDMAEWEIHGALGHGATLVIRGSDIEATAATVDVIIATPSILASIDAERCRGRVAAVAVAGEPCPVSLADTWSKFARFHNSCGPTETTIVNTVQHYAPSTIADQGLTIGAPTPNNTVYVLDEHLNPLPIGEVGEMWAGGDCVTAGYLGRDERTEQLNADRYRDDPFLGGGRRMFRTRDLGRWTADGELEHFGRTDDQVKVRGFRVELDSVSALIEAEPACDRAVTLKYDDRNLVAFAEPAEVDPEAATEAVAGTLPYYAVPARVFTMAELPRTDRGKIDKRALRDLAEATLGSSPAERAGVAR